MDKLPKLIGRRVAVLTRDGRLLAGTLRGFDQGANVVLAACEERVFHTTADDPTGTNATGTNAVGAPMMELLPLGVFLLKGDSVVLIGEIDEERDASIGWADRKTPYPPLPSM